MASGVTLLERAVDYTVDCLHLTARASPSAATPCVGWSLRDLLAHLHDSLAALHEAADSAAVRLTPNSHDPADPVSTLRDRARLLPGAWVGKTGRTEVDIGGLPLAAEAVTSAGALEVAVHGWDVALACGQRKPIPSPLAEELLALGPLLVTEADRGIRFAPPVPVSPFAGACERLLGFLGRSPRRVGGLS